MLADIIAESAGVIAAFAVGATIGRTNRRKPKAVCQCTHGLQAHDATGCLVVLGRDATHWDEVVVSLGYEYLRRQRQYHSHHAEPDLAVRVYPQPE